MVQVTLFSVSFLVLYLTQLIFSVWMNRLNQAYIRHKGNQVPRAFRGLIDADKLAQINAYSLDNLQSSTVRKTVGDAVLLLLILSGLLSYAEGWLAGFGFPYLVTGILFFAGLATIFFFLGLPFDYHHTFVIEEKYGFNRSTRLLWITDNLKSYLLSMCLVILVMLPILWTIRAHPNSWWLWAFLVVSLYQLCMAVLYPILIAPLFNTFVPLEDRILADKIEGLLQRVGMKSRGVFQMDAQRRSSHSNAYVAGLGKTRRIVLFDSLVASHDHGEILAVLAHEIGHIRCRHLLKSLPLAMAGTLGAFYLTHLLLGWELLYASFGRDPTRPFAALFIIAIFLQRAGFFLAPLPMALSRRFERRADQVASELLGSPEPIVSALKKLAAHNLANLSPHPLYVRFNYAHPPIPQRVELLEETEPRNL
jgi:STE24 endopeptidase